MQYLLLTLLYIALWVPLTWGSLPRHPDSLKYRECEPTASKCVFWLVIKQQLTMIFRGDLVYAHKGKLYLYNEHPSNYTTEVSHHLLQGVMLLNDLQGGSGVRS